MRIRTIKPDFFLHEGLYDAEKQTKLPLRVAFAGLWCAADREGRFKWEPRKLKAQILPYDEVEFGNVLDGLAAGGFITKYVSGEMVFGLIPNFKKHQHVNIRESESALPDPKSGACTCINVQDYRQANVPSEIRKLVLERDGEKCCRCNSTESITIDHILPRSMGGTHNPLNLRPMCRACNSRRPVSGDAFLQDIASDGFTLEHLHEVCKHVLARENTSPARVPSLPVPVPSLNEGESEGKQDKVDRYHPDCRAVLHYLNETACVHYREVHANLNIISQRLFEDGVTLEGVQAMIRRQSRKWRGTEFADYLRPETLFRKSKFDGYYAARDEPIPIPTNGKPDHRAERAAKEYQQVITPKLL